MGTSGWIDTRDGRYPPHLQPVEVWHYSHVVAGRWDEQERYWLVEGHGRASFVDITHWRPVPEVVA